MVGLQGEREGRRSWGWEEMGPPLMRPPSFRWCPFLGERLCCVYGEILSGKRRKKHRNFRFIINKREDRREFGDPNLNFENKVGEIERA